jgi:hypothetical protein
MPWVLVVSVRTALYATLTADTGLTRLLASPESVFHQVAPLDARFPYVIFAKQTGRPTWAFDGRLYGELWLVKAVCEGASATAAEDIDGELDRTLNDAAPSIDAKTLLYLRRDSDINYLEQGDGTDMWHHVGGVYRLVTEPA